VKEARNALKDKFRHSQTARGSSGAEVHGINTPSNAKEGKEMRNWVGVSDKISKRDMEKIDVSKEKD
jgi:signal recognition particle receptor subunit alpha